MILTGKVAEDFITQATKREQEPKIDFSKQAKNMKQILKKSKLQGSDELIGDLITI